MFYENKRNCLVNIRYWLLLYNKVTAGIISKNITPFFHFSWANKQISSAYEADDLELEINQWEMENT